MNSIERRISTLERKVAVHATESTEQFLLRLPDNRLAYMKRVWEAGCRLFGERLVNSDCARPPEQSRLDQARYWTDRYCGVYMAILEQVHFQRMGGEFPELLDAAKNDPLLSELLEDTEKEGTIRAAALS